MLTAARVKQEARMLGADLVGIAPIERWAGAPLQMDPRQIMPEARSMIVMAFRVMRGSLRGIEEGTFFSNYSSMGYGGLTYLYMPLVVINLCKMIEDEGYEAIPIGHQSDWREIDNEGFMSGRSRPVAPGRAAPDVMIHLRLAGYLAGLGEIGYSKVFLTPQFGPRQRLGVVLTEAELEPDPLYAGPQLCNKCMVCAKNCPGNAIDQTKTIRVHLPGVDRTIEWGEIDCQACAIAFTGALPAEAGETGSYYDGRTDMKPGSHTPFPHKPRNLYNSGQAICGGRGCVRSCMISLESRGVLQNKFKTRFRRRKPWSVNWDAEPDENSRAAFDAQNQSALAANPPPNERRFQSDLFGPAVARPRNAPATPAATDTAVPAAPAAPPVTQKPVDKPD